jgi:DNA (cytosine-5)-methyltransferase 1
MNNNNILKVGTDFSGIGAPEQALTNLGINYKSVFACEIDKFARKSYEAIHPKPETFYNDITERNHAEVEQLDLYVAGFPCQAFSIAGSRKGFDDVRGTLFFNVADFIRINQPKFFILENVKGLLSHNNGATFQTIVSLLSDNGGTANGQVSIPYFEDGLGYHIYYSVLNSKDYGVPQNRERIFIVGFRDFRSFSFPKSEPLKCKANDFLQLHAPEKYYFSKTALKILQNKNGAFNYQNNYIKIPSGGKFGYELAEVGNIINYSFIKSKTRRGRVGRGYAFTLDRNCEQAIIEKCNKNKIKFRKLTPLECWRLQGFSDLSFYKAKNVSSDVQLYRQVGNSITVDVVMFLLKKIL